MVSLPSRRQRRCQAWQPVGLAKGASAVIGGRSVRQERSVVCQRVTMRIADAVLSCEKTGMERSDRQAPPRADLGFAKGWSGSPAIRRRGA